MQPETDPLELVPVDYQAQPPGVKGLPNEVGMFTRTQVALREI